MYIKDPIYFNDDIYLPQYPALESGLSGTGRKKYFATSLELQAADKVH